MTAQLVRALGLLHATAPPERRGIRRDGVGLLVTDRAARTHAHERFFNLPAILRTGDLLVVNDSATLPAALSAVRTNGDTLALHVATMIDRRLWMAEPRGTVLSGEELELPDGGSAVMIAPVDPEHPRLWYTWFQLPLPMVAYLERHGAPIRYGYVTQPFPLSDYQTMFARNSGSSEMPSAARPFTPRVTRALKRAAIELVAITLHCGVASFERPERPAAERYAVSREAADLVNRARSERRRVIAVGSTVLRALESAEHNGELAASSGWTDLVIDEHYHVRTVDALLTGFHDATATHQSLLRAFLAPKLLQEAYAAAADQGYYAHEFGDVHLIL
ncbi:MAG TPA: S-adenosylmethionine:tRNA ribosyltransferase-isomerase [Candidatus Baltobacteraceae bacterium]